MQKCRILLTAFLCLTLLAWTSTPAHALDKRVKLLFKTSGYGAAAGAVIGAGTMALGLGGFRNVLMGASSGLYAGILLAAYIVATPDEGRAGERGGNPYRPRRPVGGDDWEEESNSEEELREHLPAQGADEQSQLELLPKQQPQVVVWAPIVSVSF